MAAQRKRGYYLSDSGWERLWEAIHAEFPEGHGRTSKGDEDERYNLAKIEALTQTGTGGSVSDETISKIIYRTERTDKSKIQSLFRAFELYLWASDLTQDAPIPEPIKKDDPNFVGRDTAIAALNALATQGAKVILIQGLGGIGKTTLAKKYLNDRFNMIIEFPIARETKDIASIKGLLETKLRELGEEPGEELIVSLERLKQKLKTEKIGILIDNLEPALNGSGQFIQEHRSYVELLRTLADSSLQSLTLITSREKLNEEGIKIDFYRLSGLTLEAWQQYFDHQKIIRNVEHDTLKDIRKAFYGNAEAMNVISKAIMTDYNRDLESYWLDNREDLLIEPTLKNLIKKQFDRLLDIRLNDAYNLLCRLGCYRYQDVPTVPEAGLICLLWDVKENQHKKRTINVLKGRGLVKFKDGEYFLHPVIREEAISRLRNSDAWEGANRQAAEFWTESVSTIETVEDAIKAFEAYHHFLAICDYEQAGSVIIKLRNNKWDRLDSLGSAFYRLGLLNTMLNCINPVKAELKPSYCLSRLYNILGNLYWLSGNPRKSIQNNEKSEIIADYCLKNKLDANAIEDLKQIKAVSYFNRGLCYLDLGEIEESIKFVNEFVSVFQNLGLNLIEKYKTYDIVKYSVVLAVCYLYIGNKEAAEINIRKTVNIEEKLTFGGQAYKLLYLGLTYTKLDRQQEAQQMYEEAIRFSEETNYSQLEGKARTGLGELYRIQKDYNTAIDNHFQSIRILDKIGAKCDLAEAYFQLALTYQAIGDQSNSKTYFDNALDLWGPKQIDAPKQIERVKKAMKND